MSAKPIDEIIKQFDQLPTEEREQLLIELSRRQHADGIERPSRSLLHSFQERGLVGSIKGLPADWSTNPSYLNGFGKPTDAQ